MFFAATGFDAFPDAQGGDGQRDDGIEPPPAEQGVGEQAHQDACGEVAADEVLRALAGNGFGGQSPVRNEDVARLSPLGHAHINMLGRYAFSPRTDRALGPLCDPDTVDE
jgi:hypothetical protein